MIDTIRHDEVFSRIAFGDRRIDIIGAGATGSKIVLSLAKLGIENIHVWDFDKVEKHNPSNQVYGNNHVGMLKVDALKKFVEEQTGTIITTYCERVDGRQRFGEVVFLLTDTMASRREIWMKGIRYKPQIKLMVETRMGHNSGRIYTVNPNNPVHVRGWEKTLYSDEEAQVSVCGAKISVGPTADRVSSDAVWQFVRWFNGQEKIKLGQNNDDQPENEMVFSAQPMMTVASDFE